jgi:hypothetical protein
VSFVSSVVRSPSPRGAREPALDPVEELEAVHVAGEEPAFEQVEGQNLQTGNAQSAVGD